MLSLFAAGFIAIHWVHVAESKTPPALVKRSLLQWDSDTESSNSWWSGWHHGNRDRETVQSDPDNYDYGYEQYDTSTSTTSVPDTDSDYDTDSDPDQVAVGEDGNSEQQPVSQGDDNDAKPEPFRRGRGRGHGDRRIRKPRYDDDGDDDAYMRHKQFGRRGRRRGPRQPADDDDMYSRRGRGWQQRRKGRGRRGRHWRARFDDDDSRRHNRRGRGRGRRQSDGVWTKPDGDDDKKTTAVPTTTEAQPESAEGGKGKGGRTKRGGKGGSWARGKGYGNGKFGRYGRFDDNKGNWAKGGDDDIAVTLPANEE